MCSNATAIRILYGYIMFLNSKIIKNILRPNGSRSIEMRKKRYRCVDDFSKILHNIFDAIAIRRFSKCPDVTVVFCHHQIPFLIFAGRRKKKLLNVPITT